MNYTYLDLLTTPDVIEAQRENGARDQWEDFAGKRQFTQFDDAARAFISERDSFYMASNSQSGWPYLQHRGGPTGFLKLLDETTLGFADYRGNRQYISLGNVKSDDRISLFLMDYAGRKRMKILARLSVHSLSERPDLAERILDPEYPGVVERLMTFELAAYDWNCPQHIVQRFTTAQVNSAIASTLEELEALRAENRQLKALLER